MIKSEVLHWIAAGALVLALAFGTAIVGESIFFWVNGGPA